MNESELTQDDIQKCLISSGNLTLVDGAGVSHLDAKRSSNKLPPGTITVDAVHPFFTSYRNIQNYHCLECNEDFETSPKSLKHHFVSKRHTPVCNCTYCNLPVYEYIHNGNRIPYHRCEEEITVSKEGDTIDDSPGSSTSSCLLDRSSDISQSSNTMNSSILDASTEITDT